MNEQVKTFCRNCQASCGMVLDVADGKITGYAADAQHPISRGYFCIKGAMSVELHNGAEGRLLAPRKRGADGGWQTIPPDAALGEIAARLSALVQEHGPRSVGLFYGTGAYSNTLGMAFAKSFLHAVGSPNLFGTMTIDQSAKWVTMGRIGTMRSGKRSMSEADVVLLVGSNPLISHQGYPLTPMAFANPARNLKDEKRRGVKLIVVDPRVTETARLADLHLQLIPGEDAALFAGMLNVILSNGWQHEEFCHRFVDQLDDLHESVRPFTLLYTASRTGVSEAKIEEAARLFAKSNRSVAGTGTGPNMVAHSNLADHLIECLNVVCGGYRRAGDSTANAGALFPQRLIEDVVPPCRTWEQLPKCRTENTGKVGGEFPSALLPDEILAPGPDKIRALIVMAGNPALAICDPDKVVRAFGDLELLVTIDPRMTATASLSHYVIAPTLQFERHDLTWLGDSAFSSPFAQYARPAVGKPAETIDEWEFFWELARRMKLALTFKLCPPGIDFSAFPGGFSVDMRDKPSPDDLIAKICEGSEVTFDTLKANSGGVAPKREPIVVEGAGEDGGVRLEVCSPDVALELHRTRAESSDDRFAYRLATRRLLETLNSAFRHNKRVERAHETNRAGMHPDDLRKEGLFDGDAIEISSEFGSLVGYVKPDRNVRCGVISMAHMWGVLEKDPYGLQGGHTGRLVSIDRYIETINHMPRQTGIPVNVRKVPILQ